MKRVLIIILIIFIICVPVQLLAGEIAETPSPTEKSEDTTSDDVIKETEKSAKHARPTIKTSRPGPRFDNMGFCASCLLFTAIVDINGSYGFFGNTSHPEDGINKRYSGSESGGVKIRMVASRGGKVDMVLPFEFTFSNVRFKGESGLEDHTIKCINVNFNFIFRRRKQVKPFIFAGPGFYIPDEKRDEFGINAGAGVLVGLTQHVMLDVSGVYHTIFDSGIDTSFTELRAGLNFNF